jgi:hypothetical protein
MQRRSISVACALDVTHACVGIKKSFTEYGDWFVSFGRAVMFSIAILKIARCQAKPEPIGS